MVENPDWCSTSFRFKPDTTCLDIPGYSVNFFGDTITCRNIRPDGVRKDCNLRDDGKDPKDFCCACGGGVPEELEFCTSNEDLILPCSPEFNSALTDGECADDKCECSKEDVAAYIYSTGKMCESITDVDCWFVTNTVILDVTKNPCTDETDAIKFEGIWAESSLQNDLNTVKYNTKFDVNETFKVSDSVNLTAASFLCICYSLFTDSNQFDDSPSACTTPTF